LLPFEDRYTRQRQLPQVGVRGQQAIAKHQVVLGNEPAAAIAALYLQRAGVQGIEHSAGVPVTGTSVLGALVAAAPVAAAAAAQSLCFDAAQSFGAGCLRALAELCIALGPSPAPELSAAPRPTPQGKTHEQSEESRS
jgi:hypothetical protein